MEELFSKSLPVVLKQSEREEKQTQLGITILLHVTTTPVHKKELVLRVTDENDPFFLFNLSIGEADFQGLKAQQGLLVDFAAFPQKFIDLLDLCLSEAGQERPKFLLQFWVASEDHGYSRLQVVETNPFRHLTHLQLQLVPASDTCLKKYLADCLLSLKVENEQLNERLISTKSDLTAQLAQCQTTLSSRGQELERLRTEWSSHSAQLSSEHAAQLAAEREKNLQSLSESQTRHDREKRELEQSHVSKVVVLEARLAELEASQKELTDHKYRSQAAIRELKAKLKATEEECVRLQEELQAVRRDNSSLDSGLHERDKTVSQLSTRVAVLEQELKDKEQVLGHTSEQLRESQERVRGGEVALEQTQRRLSKVETAFNATSHEVLKIQRLEESLQAARDKLEENTELLKTNENVIGWLNKQINEQMVGGRVPLPSGPASLPLSTIRHSSPLTSSLSPFSSTPAQAVAGVAASPLVPGVTGSLVPAGYLPTTGQASAWLGAGVGDPGDRGAVDRGAGVAGEGGERQVLGSLASKENAKHQVVFRGGLVGKTSGMAVPSPLSSHSLSAQDVASKTQSPSTSTVPLKSSPAQVKTAGLSSQHQRQKRASQEPGLDPKYLPQPTQAPPTLTSVTPGVLRPPAGGGRSTRAVRGRGGKRAGEQAPLSSAYFPNS